MFPFELPDELVDDEHAVKAANAKDAAANCFIAIIPSAESRTLFEVHLTR